LPYAQLKYTGLDKYTTRHNTHNHSISDTAEKDIPTFSIWLANNDFALFHLMHLTTSLPFFVLLLIALIDVYTCRIS
jgi:hypothetical protein